MIRRVIFESARGVAELDGVECPVGTYSVDEAYAFCERIARGHFDSYALARRFVPETMRPHVWALYAFARSADDFADEPRYEGRRRELLTAWEDKLDRAFHRDAEHPIFVALADTVDKCKLPIAPLRDLINAYVIDLSVSRYATAAQLDRYAGLAAQPIGRLFLYLFGQTDPTLHRFSDEICTAVQIAKVCQDLSLDLMRDRVYLPAEDMRHFGVTEAMLEERHASAEVRDLIRYEVSRARSLLERGRPLIDRLRRIDAGLAFQVALIYHSTTALLEQIERADFDVLSRRPRLGNAEKADVLVRASSARWSNAMIRRVG